MDKSWLACVSSRLIYLVGTRLSCAHFFLGGKYSILEDMKVIVTHTSPDWDAITSVWVIKRFLDGWERAEVRFVPAGERINKISKYANKQISNVKTVIEDINGDEVIHVDTGLGALDHHQTPDKSVCGASLSWGYVKQVESSKFKVQSDNYNWTARAEAIDRIVKVVVAIDHFQEVFWPEPAADYQEFGMFGLLEGLKFQKPDQDSLYVEKGMEWLDMMLHNFENRIWAENEIKEKGKEFKTRFGKGLALESVNGATVKLAQKLGYAIVVRKDPRKGNVQIKAKPEQASSGERLASSLKRKTTLDLTLVSEQLAKMDPEATWFLHISKKMLLNGSMKNPAMKPTNLSLDQVVRVVQMV